MKNWCGKHEPSGDGTCPEHGLNLYELHDDELANVYGMSAIFYCQELYCDYLEFNRVGFQDRTYKQHLFNSQGHGADGKDGIIIAELFKNTARLKILYHKLAQREGDGK